MIHLKSIIHGCIFIIIISLLLQKLYGPTLMLKGLQVVSASIGNFSLIMSAKNIRWNTSEAIFIILIVACILLGVLVQNSVKILFFGIFPLINIIALTIGLLLASNKEKYEKLHIDKTLFMLIGIFCVINFLLIIPDWFASNRPFVFFRATGLLFKPSSASFTLCICVFLIMANRTIRHSLFLMTIFSFKSMSSLLFTLVSIIGTSHLAQSYNNRFYLLFFAPILALTFIYIADLLYSRHLWVSVGTRFGIFSEFSLYGGGIGFGSNIAMNATGLETRISDGTLSLLKFQFGILGIVWSFMLVFYSIRLAINSNFVFGASIGLALFAFNIPEVAFLSLLLPYLLFESYRND